jgi:hypothetical protein
MRRRILACHMRRRIHVGGKIRSCPPFYSVPSPPFTNSFTYRILGRYSVGVRNWAGRW